MRQKAEEKAQQKHRELLQKTERALEKVKREIEKLTDITASAASRLMRIENYSRRVYLIEWLETQFLLCAALALLKAEQPVVYDDVLPEPGSIQEKRKKLDLAITCIFERLEYCLPNDELRFTLKSALRLTEHQCDPILRLLHFAPELTWQEFSTNPRSGKESIFNRSGQVSDTSTTESSDDSEDSRTSADADSSYFSAGSPT